MFGRDPSLHNSRDNVKSALSSMKLLVPPVVESACHMEVSGAKTQTVEDRRKWLAHPLCRLRLACSSFARLVDYILPSRPIGLVPPTQLIHA